MKKMITAIAIACAIMTGTVRADDDCAKPTEYVLNFLSASGMPKPINIFYTGSADWVERLKKGYVSNVNMVGGHTRTGEIKQGLSAAEYAQHRRDIVDGKDVGQGKVAAAFEMRTTNDVWLGKNVLEIHSSIHSSEERPLFQGEDWETMKAEIERNDKYHGETQVDDCTECHYVLNVVIDEMNKKFILHTSAYCKTTMNKDVLIAKVIAERAAVERLKNS
jgi:hypothetical protein